ncbi:conserved hypothetical protein [Histoplasma mississippiense (nom. inval.)]|uniref:conserved hypothetical protein n=1 Tax=Ajellomyces capsulatus (strain NAm1 / WU24) TaxID=2059318 RepID=UPI000157BD3B|nr:conserved hypothetical protein [Histoplasma mississippiense (nom. inval.)]EDN06150.1 conserved hypothetical protein [Histoplasma mississippiense (nom. inval.)]
MSQYFFDLLYTFTDCMCCFPNSPQLKINNRSFKLLRLLGEGGFSYVYLVQDKNTSELFALKKIRCPFVRNDAEAADTEAAASRGRPARRVSRRDSDDTEHEPLMDGEVTISQEGVDEGDFRPYAHRDIKPGNIMIDDDGLTPIVMDLGSLAPSPIAITSRSLALAVQDTAAEHSTMPYRAPELFDVKTGSIIDTKVDIWSLGCTIYACLVGKSPFEARSEETGGSLSMCVLGGDWRFPDEKSAGQKGKGTASAGTGSAGVGEGEGSAAAVDGETGSPARKGGISEASKEVVRRCLQVEPADRPDVDELIELLKTTIEKLPDDE